MEQIYWVLSRDCNQKCPHCYNHSQPGAPGLTVAEMRRCVAHLPEPGSIPLDRIALSGGEALAWPDLLFATLDALFERYEYNTRLIVQTNADLLDEAMLDRLIEHHVSRVSISSMDKYHARGTLQRRDYLQKLLESRGFVDSKTLIKGHNGRGPWQPTYLFWGATDDLWIGPLWPRGRAQEKKLTKARPENRFCEDRGSGAKNFLDYHSDNCEVNVQLGDVYPCCPMTCRPIGSLLDEPLLATLDRCAAHPVYRALNEGRPEKMGEYLGLSAAYGEARTQALGNQCLWCDEFFTKHATDLLAPGAVTERGDQDLRLLTLGTPDRA